MAGGDEGGHVKHGADFGAATEDVALTAELTTVVIKWSDASEGGCLGLGEGTKFGHERDEGCGGEQANALDFLEAFDPGQQTGRRSDFGLHERFELGDLFAEDGHGFSDEAEEMFVCQSLGKIDRAQRLNSEIGWQE